MVEIGDEIKFTAKDIIRCPKCGSHDLDVDYRETVGFEFACFTCEHIWWTDDDDCV